MKIEEYITENREQMDDQMPRDGHQCRFEARLMADTHRCHRRKLAWQISWTAVAAAIVVPLFLLLPSHPSMPAASEEPVAEVAEYYRRQLATEIGKVESLLPPDAKVRQEVMNTLRATQDSLRPLTDFPADLSNEQKIAIVAVNYGTTINAVKNVGKIFQEINTNN